MLLTAQRLCTDMDARAIVTGESLGQVASQTLSNILVESHDIKTPILRPLISWDKDEIVKKAKDIGTYDISIEKGLCCLLAPQHPKTSAQMAGMEREEERLDMKAIVERLVAGVKVEDV